MKAEKELIKQVRAAHQRGWNVDIQLRQWLNLSPAGDFVPTREYGVYASAILLDDILSVMRTEERFFLRRADVYKFVSAWVAALP